MGATASVPDFLCPVGTHPRCVHIAFLYKSCAFIIRTYLGYALRLSVMRLAWLFIFETCNALLPFILSSCLCHDFHAK